MTSIFGDFNLPNRREALADVLFQNRLDLEWCSVVGCLESERVLLALKFTSEDDPVVLNMHPLFSLWPVQLTVPCPSLYMLHLRALATVSDRESAFSLAPSNVTAVSGRQHFPGEILQKRGLKSSTRGIPMSSMTGSFEKRLRSVQEKYGSDVVSIIVIFFGLAAILIFLSPR